MKVLDAPKRRLTRRPTELLAKQMSEIQEVEKEYNSDESDDHSKLVSH